MTWTPLTSPVDHVLLAGQRSPSIATISGAGSIRKWDVRKGYGLTGARPVFRGLDVARFRVTILLLTEADWEAWHQFKELLAVPPRLPPPTSTAAERRARDESVTTFEFDAIMERRERAYLASGRPRALDIWHPVLEECGISMAVVESVGQLEHDGTGGWTVPINFIEYRKPEPMRPVVTEGSEATPQLSATQQAIRLEREFGEGLERELEREGARAERRFR